MQAEGIDIGSRVNIKEATISLIILFDLVLKAQLSSVILSHTNIINAP